MRTSAYKKSHYIRHYFFKSNDHFGTPCVISPYRYIVSGFCRQRAIVSCYFFLKNTSPVVSSADILYNTCMNSLFSARSKRSGIKLLIGERTLAHPFSKDLEFATCAPIVLLQNANSFQSLDSARNRAFNYYCLLAITSYRKFPLTPCVRMHCA